jgi:hypothetical protein
MFCNSLVYVVKLYKNVRRKKHKISFVNSMWAGILQSVLGLATGWIV